MGYCRQSYLNMAILPFKQLIEFRFECISLRIRRVTVANTRVGQE